MSSESLASLSQARSWDDKVAQYPLHHRERESSTNCIGLGSIPQAHSCNNLLVNETGSRSPCMRPRSDPAKMKNSTQTTLPHFNFSVTAKLKDVTSRLIILINEEINKANCMISNSAKLDSMTEQHTQFGVSASHGSRDMARTKSWRGRGGGGMNAGKTI